MSPAVAGTRARIALCGEKRIAEDCLDFLQRRTDTTICAVVTEPGDWEADLAGWGADHDTPVLMGNVNEHVEQLSALGLDLLLSVQYRKRIRGNVLALPRIGALNLHFGLLPRYAGCHPLAWAVLNGEKEAGATLHFMTERFDEGDIVQQVAVPVTPLTTARDLYERVSAAALDLFVDVYPQLLAGPIPRRQQELAKQVYYPKSSIDFRRDSVVDWRRSTRDVQRAACAFTFEPFQLPASALRTNDGSLRRVSVTDTSPWDGDVDGGPYVPGTLLATLDDGSVLIATGDGALRVRTLDKLRAESFCARQGLRAGESRFLPADEVM